MLKKILPLALCAALGSAALADEAAVKKALEGRKIPVKSVAKAGALGLYEVFTGEQIIYTDEKANFIIDGAIIDLKAGKNLTDERMRKLTAIKFSELPLDQAIKQVRGDGKRVMATFEDPNCGYCKRLAKDLVKLDNVTIYTFLMPILSPDSTKKSKTIWCAADKSKAWNDWMVDGKEPTGKDDCDTAIIQKNVEFGRKLGINGTPTIFFTNGERIPGAMPLAQIEQRLNDSK